MRSMPPPPSATTGCRRPTRRERERERLHARLRGAAPALVLDGVRRRRAARDCDTFSGGIYAADRRGLRGRGGAARSPGRLGEPSFGLGAWPRQGPSATVVASTISRWSSPAGATPSTSGCGTRARSGVASVRRPPLRRSRGADCNRPTAYAARHGPFRETSRPTMFGGDDPRRPRAEREFDRSRRPSRRTAIGRP